MSWERDIMSWERDIMSWERDIMSWERDLMSWERDKYFFHMTPQYCRTNVSISLRAYASFSQNANLSRPFINITQGRHYKSSKYVLKRVSFGSKDCTKELKLECAYFLGQTS